MKPFNMCYYLFIMENMISRSISCICHGKTFDEIFEQAEALGLERFEDIPEKTECGQCCKMCLPYLKKEWNKKNDA